MAFGVGDRVKILHSSNLVEVGKESIVMSVCGKGASRWYHLRIDGEQKQFYPQNLKLVKRAEDKSKIIERTKR